MNHDERNTNLGRIPTISTKLGIPGIMVLVVSMNEHAKPMEERRSMLTAAVDVQDGFP